MSESLEDRIIRHEGMKTVPYLDTTDNWTIGVGHKITVDQAQNTYINGISRMEALAMLEEDIARCKQEAATAFPWLLGLDDCRKSVIIEMIFQLGLAGVEAFHKMIAAIRIQDWAMAADEMLNSEWHNQTPARCEELANLMLTPEGEPS